MVFTCQILYPRSRPCYSNPNVNDTNSDVIVYINRYSVCEMEQNLTDVVVSVCGLLALEYKNQILNPKKKKENFGFEKYYSFFYLISKNTKSFYIHFCSNSFMDICLECLFLYFRKLVFHRTSKDE